MMKTNRNLCLALLAILLLANASFATTIVPMSVERLTQSSTNVVVAQAADSWTETNAAQTLIFTVTRFRVSQNLKGDAGQTVTVRQLGGRTAAFMQKVAGVRHWQTGDNAVLFLRPSDANDGTLSVTGLMQGDFRVVQADPASETMVSNGVTGVHAYDPSKKTLTEYSGSRMSLSDLKSRVQKAVQQ